MNISVYAIPGLKFESKAEIIEEAVCEVFDTTPEKIRLRTRVRDVVEPRMMAMYFLQRYTGMGVMEIGRKIGGMHHASVIHSINTIDNLKNVDRIFERKFNQVHEKIKQRLL